MNVNHNRPVLWLTSSYPRSKNDSASVFLRYLSSSIANKQIHIDLLFPDHIEVNPHYTEDNKSRFCFRYFLPRLLQNLAYGSGILPNLKQNKWLLLQVPFFVLSLFIRACFLTATRKPKLIHAHWIFPIGFVAVIVGKVFRIPVVITAHGGDAFAMNGSQLSWIKRWTIKNCSCWTSNTKTTATAFGQNLPPPTIIPMGIDYQKFSSGNRLSLRAQIENETFIILFVGRLVEKKGVRDLISAFSLLNDVYQNQSVLWLVGDGNERDSLEQQVKELNLQDKIKFFGKLPNQQLPDFYASADLFVAPSIIDTKGDTEGQGVMLLEAMASGLPIISTNIGGITEIVEDGSNGILVSQQNTEELKNTIEKLLNNSNVRTTLSNNARKTAQNYDWINIGEKFSALYKRLI
jgi:glycosyltransferase involved in cell wall biosynthesis